MDAEPTDDELIARGRAGDESALVVLYHRYRPRVFGYLFRMTGDRDLAEEAFAATFARLFEVLPRYRPVGRFTAYLFQIARSRLADEQAARRRLGSRANPPPTLDDLPDPARPPDDAATTEELVGLVRVAVHRLPDHLREVVVLRVYEGLDYATVGEIVGAGEPTVRSRMRYALRWLRDALPKDLAGL